MSNFKSPFLNENQNEMDVNENDQEKINSHSINTINYQPTLNNNEENVPEIVKDKDEDGEMEIKEDSKLLRNIIIILIIILILFLAWLGLYNFIFKKRLGDNPQALQGISTPSGNNTNSNENSESFEMKSSDFKADSIITK